MEMDSDSGENVCAHGNSGTVSFLWQMLFFAMLWNCCLPAVEIERIEKKTRYLDFIVSTLCLSLNIVVVVHGQRRLPFCLREIWVLTACLTTVKATADRFSPRSVTPDVEKDFYRLLGDLYSYARTKVLSP